MNKSIIFVSILLSISFFGCNQQQSVEVVTDTPVLTQKVSLYYYNQIKDKEIDESIPCSAEAVLPVEREIPITNTPIKDTLNLLLEGNINSLEASIGFQTEFPDPGFKLTSAELSEDGVLTLDFTDENGFSTGGSCRVGLLANQIIKTAKQFPEVKDVRFKSDWLFQP